MDSEELKPCPFCGSNAEFGSIENKKHPDFGGHFVYCTNNLCQCSSALIFPLMDDVKELLICRWNRRENEDAK